VIIIIIIIIIIIESLLSATELYVDRDTCFCVLRDSTFRLWATSSSRPK